MSLYARRSAWRPCSPCPLPFRPSRTTSCWPRCRSASARSGSRCGPGAARGSGAGLQSSSSRLPDRPESLASMLRNALWGRRRCERRAAQVALPRQADRTIPGCRPTSREPPARPELERPARAAVAWRREQLRGGLLSRPGRDRCLPPGPRGALPQSRGRRSRRCSCWPGREIPGWPASVSQGGRRFDALTWFHLGP